MSSILAEQTGDYAENELARKVVERGRVLRFARACGLVDRLGAKLAPKRKKGGVLADSAVSKVLLLRL